MVAEITIKIVVEIVIEARFRAEYILPFIHSGWYCNGIRVSVKVNVKQDHYKG